LSISGTSKVCEVTPSGVREFEVQPGMAGLASHPLSMLEGSDVSGNARAILDLFDGHAGPFRDMVLLNAAAGLLVLGRAGDLREGAMMAAEAIDSGKARDSLWKLRRASLEEPTA
jgi:anthranilate phosphoribosyltransferase